MAYIMSSSNFSGLWSTSLNFSEKEIMTFRGHFTTCKQRVMENWMQQNSFIHSPCVIRHLQYSKNLSLLQGLQWQTKQAWRQSTRSPLLSPKSLELYFPGHFFLSIKMTLSRRSIDPSRSPLPGFLPLLQKRCWVLEEVVSEEVEPEVSALLGPDPKFLAKIKFTVIRCGAQSPGSQRWPPTYKDKAL